MQKILLTSLVCAFIAVGLQAQILDDPTLVGYWEFQGNAVDASSFLNNGVSQGNPSFVPDEQGAANEAIFFNGATDWVNFGDDPSVRFSSQESFTLNVDARPLKPLSGSLSGAYGNMLRYDDFDLSDGDEPQSRGVMLFRLRYYNSGFRVEFAVGQGPSTYSTLLSNELPYDAWYSFTAVRNVAKDSMYIYVNGCLDTLMKDAEQISWNTNGQFLKCGKYESIFSTEYYYGYMQSAHVFKKALNNAEVFELSGDSSEVTDMYATVCQGGSFMGYDQPGQYYIAYPTPESCDSIVRLNLDVLPPLFTYEQVSICKGESYNGHLTSGNYIDTLQTADGCDSIVQLQLNVYMVFLNIIEATICEGESYEGHTMSGIYIDTLTSVHGCDSLVVLNLVVLPPQQTTALVTICSGESYAGHAAPGVYMDTLLTAYGCDSMVIINLEVLPVIQSEIQVYLCDGESYNGYTTSGFYTDSLISHLGCDSILTLSVTVSENYVYDTVLVSDCENALGIPAGIYLDTIVTESCDIIRTSIVKNDNLYIPNVFSPNDDGMNDYFEVYPSQTNIEIRRFVVYDRWGDQIFEINNAYEVRWDGYFRGKRLNPGVFTYMIEFTCGGALNRRAGTVTLVL
ncbi:MAG: gliding motility-associated C-terminal domain-containing protein [Saprospiraceae bacterium]|nr:gliding motility-associated C-terminal domain-containing protein [Saprospiraceae bacterium]